MKVTKDELLILTEYEEFSLVVRVLKDFDFAQLQKQYQRQNKYDKNNVYGFESWIIEKGYCEVIPVRRFDLGGPGVRVEEQ